ncbi:hypothetical protein E2C01_059279 [Portunus trituberculatus]|uniref:Uncharacterized protein n=1 Tax=Portunus trituberculatus TaxID=210409 RepID=A0A5B7GYQ5_PORTR|nr:hypothetical protein [Portunus trituberculatus]
MLHLKPGNTGSGPLRLLNSARPILVWLERRHAPPGEMLGTVKVCREGEAIRVGKTETQLKTS